MEETQKLNWRFFKETKLILEKKKKSARKSSQAIYELYDLFSMVSSCTNDLGLA